MAYHIHPDTGRPYHWPAGELPARAALPEINEEMALDFIEQCRPLILECGGRFLDDRSAIRSGTPSATAAEYIPGDESNPFRAINDTALARPEVWVPDLFPRAKRSANGAWRVRSRDLGRELEEDISISADGIVDFGVHDMGDAREGRRTPIDLVIEWGGAADAVQAARWLADRIELTTNLFALRARGRQASDEKRETGEEEKSGAAAGANKDDSQSSPRPLPSGLPSVPSFDHELLPQALRPWVQDIAERMQCPPDFPAVTGIVAMGSTIGRQLAIRPKKFDDWTVVPNLWAGASETLG